MWRFLRLYLDRLYLQGFVEALGRSFIDEGHLTDAMVKYIMAGSTVHINRHVREASFQLIR